MRLLFLSLAAAVLLGLSFAAAKDSADALVMAPMALNSYTSAPVRISSAKVLDLNGETIGHVERLGLDPAGKPQNLSVALTSGVAISIAANNASYDEQQNVVVIGLDHDQIASQSKPTK
jgi:hypothetical protein